MNAPSGNDTRPSANDTRSVFTAINPLKRRVSFRDMPNIHEYEHVSSTSTPTPSPLPSGFLDQTRTIFNAFELAQQHNHQQQRPKFKASMSSLAPTPSPMPSGFLDKTRTIFTSLEPAQQHNNQQQQMPQQQQLQNVFKFDDADDSSLSLTKSLRLPSTPSHSSADAEGMDMEEINAMTVAQTPTKLLMIDKVDKYGAINEQMNHTHVIQHTPFHNRLLSLTSTNTEMVMLNELTKRHGGSSLLFGSQEGYGLDNMSTVDQTMNIDEEQKQIFLASKTEEVGDNLDDLFAVKQSMSMDAQQQHEQQLQEGHDGLDELSVAAQSMSIICSDVQQQQQTNKSAAAADGRASSLSAAAVTLLTETPKSSHQTTTTKTVAAAVAVVAEPETPPPPMPMGHLSDADFEQWHDMAMERAMEHYCEAVQHYTDLYKPYYDEQKRVLDQIDLVKERIGKLRAEFDAAEQQHGERRRATLRSVENDANY
ncbi:hypothetical protein GPALN_004086 [Globodera pallida]|nr:hypothetical protein GPALN_004086 [Globodera pallida]